MEFFEKSKISKIVIENDYQGVTIKRPPPLKEPETANWGGCGFRFNFEPKSAPPFPEFSELRGVRVSLHFQFFTIFPKTPLKYP